MTETSVRGVVDEGSTISSASSLMSSPCLMGSVTERFKVDALGLGFRTALGQRPRSLSVHDPHFGPTGKQMTWPKPTRSGLISGCSSLGSQDCRLSLEGTSGSDAVGLDEHLQVHRPSLFRCRCRWFMPAQPVGYPMYMHIHTYSQIDIPGDLGRTGQQASRYGGMGSVHLKCQEGHLRAHTRQRT